MELSGANHLKADTESFHTFTVLEGNLVLTYQGEKLPMEAGQSVFLPANMGEYAIEGQAHLIFTTL
ncbi:MAG: cupin domain-containing protein [Veillonellaceae bacterium]|nr:cupin domain-containing protein [Veillonellaceae bacterium]